MKWILLFLIVLLLGTYARAPTPKTASLRAKYNANWIVRREALVSRLDPKLLFALWMREGSQEIWAPEGDAGELTAFQILPETGDRHCAGDWRNNFIYTARCAATYVKKGEKQCRTHEPWRLAGWYNQGRCLKHQTPYTRSVVRLMGL